MKWLEKYGFPIGAVYNLKTEGGSKARGGAEIQFCKSGENHWVKQRGYRYQQEIVDYALSEFERVHGETPPGVDINLNN